MYHEFEMMILIVDFPYEMYWRSVLRGSDSFASGVWQLSRKRDSQ